MNPQLRLVHKELRNGHTCCILHDASWDEYRVRLDYLPVTDYHTSDLEDARDTQEAMLNTAALEDQDG